jgi:hypothetical protein
MLVCSTELDIPSPVIHCTTRGLGNFNSDDDSDSEDSSNQHISWGPEDAVHHDDALVYTTAGPPHWQMNRFIDYNLPLKENGASFLGAFGLL